MTPNPAPPATPLRVRTERRRRPLIVGVVTAVAAVAMLVAGGLVMNVNPALTVTAGSRAALGTPITFTAEDATYRLVLIRADISDINVMDRAVAETDCVATFADGSSTRVDGARQTVSETTSVGSSIGSFDAVKGPTTVVCRTRTGFVSAYAVAKERASLTVLSYSLIGAGLLAGAVAVGLIVIGVRGRATFEPAAPSDVA